mmetsp:Transcript_38676/g.44166  ORF Transcript_38676/g.44166 Transcript_38676/m.44166 type:complete len:448 (+) Transcript_38676:125-1468(+)
MLTPVWACISAWALGSISAFTPPRALLRSAQHKVLILPASSAGDQPSSFSMEQDWLLIDAVPRYTVNADTGRPATFWTQLSASTPELSLLPPDHLEARYSELCQSPNKSTTGRPTPLAGPQPLVLDQWSWSEDSRKVVGVVDNSGSTVWLTVAARGWLADDPAAMMSATELKPLFFGALVSVLPTVKDARPFQDKGGWVVALGGAVYELGVPAKVTTTGAPSLAQQLSQSSLVFSLATLVVVGAVATGFVAGSSFDRFPPASSGEIIAMQNRPSGLPSAALREVPTTTTPDLTIAEQRVLQERRVAGLELQLVRKTESVVRIESKIRLDKALLEKDRAGLEKLQQLEGKKGGKAVVRDLNLGAVVSPEATTPNDLTIAEQRSQQERRVTGRELQIVRETERIAQIESKIRVDKALLEKDRAGLEKLKQLEGEKGGEAVIRGQFLEYK